MNMMMRTSDVRWISAVRVRIGYGFPELVRGPREALGYLKFRWPAVDGNDCRAAKQACADALLDLVSPDAAREAFIKACVEAKMLDEAAA